MPLFYTLFASGENRECAAVPRDREQVCSRLLEIKGGYALMLPVNIVWARSGPTETISTGLPTSWLTRSR